MSNTGYLIEIANPESLGDDEFRKLSWLVEECSRRSSYPETFGLMIENYQKEGSKESSNLVYLFINGDDKRTNQNNLLGILSAVFDFGFDIKGIERKCVD